MVALTPDEVIPGGSHSGGSGRGSSGSSGSAVPESLGQVPLGQLCAGPLSERLAALEALTASIARTDPAQEQLEHSGAQLGAASVRTHQVIQCLAAKQLEWLVAQEADGRWAADGSVRTFASFVARGHGITHTQAKKQVKLARQLRDHLPAFRSALRTGQIGMEQAQIMAHKALTSTQRIEALNDLVDPDAPGVDPAQYSGPVRMEEHLLVTAQQLRPEDFRRVVGYFACVADPEADERGYRKACEREFFEISHTTDGYHLAGFLTEEHGQQITTTLAALMSPPAPDDTRTKAQRRAQALANMARIVLDQGLAGTHASVRPHLGVLIGPEQFTHILASAGIDTTTQPLSTAEGLAKQHSPTAQPRPSDQQSPEPREWARILRQPPATWSDQRGPVPAPVLRRLATCSEVYRILFSTDNEVLNHGRAHRTFTPAQRRALIARDKHCTYPGCTAPPVICESHHARITWTDHGPTDLANGALLCFYHHDLIDSRNITMTHADGRWRFHNRHGTEITNPAMPWQRE